MTFNPGDLGYLVPYLILLVAGMLLVLAEAFYRGKDRTALVGLTVAAVERNIKLLAPAAATPAR